MMRRMPQRRGDNALYISPTVVLLEYMFHDVSPTESDQCLSQFFEIIAKLGTLWIGSYAADVAEVSIIHQNGGWRAFGNNHFDIIVIIASSIKHRSLGLRIVSIETRYGR